MTSKTIYTMLRVEGMTRAGALASIANMMAEAGPQLRPNQVQYGMTNLTNEQYTAAVDKGYLDFADNIGYGLCQWTASQRKKALWSFAKKSGVSVGDGAMQVEFFVWELQQDYRTLWDQLTTSADLDMLTDKICNTYERPAVNNYSTRRNYAHELEKIIPDEEVKPSAIDPIVLQLQACMYHDGYISRDGITGVKDANFRDVFPKYAADVASC